MNYLLPDTTRGTGYLVIVPQMSFNCHGYITGWSALTRFASTDIAIQYLKHDITFQLWRPRARSNGVYDFVGSHHLGFIGNTLRRGTTVVGGTQFFNFSSVQPQSSSQLYFQPGDVMGWYIHTLVQSIDIPLTVVYKDTSSSTDPNLRSVDMYSIVIDNAHSHKLPPCELSLTSDRTTRISSVIPYVNVDYGKLVLNFVLKCWLIIKFLVFYDILQYPSAVHRLKMGKLQLVLTSQDEL